jgi:hypothetical protein
MKVIVDDVPGDATLVCYRVTDAVPSVASHKGRCRECRQKVWIANSSPRGLRTLCTRCVLMEIDEDAVLHITEKQLADVKRRLRS